MFAPCRRCGSKWRRWACRIWSVILKRRCRCWVGGGGGVRGGAGRRGGGGGAEKVQWRGRREPLGIRAIEVDGGVAAPLNPPLSARGSVAMGWDELKKLQMAGGDLGQDCFMRNTEAG